MIALEYLAVERSFPAPGNVYPAYATQGERLLVPRLHVFASEALCLCRKRISLEEKQDVNPIPRNNVGMH